MRKELSLSDRNCILEGLCPSGTESSIFLTGDIRFNIGVYVGPNTQLLGEIHIEEGVHMAGNIVIDGTDGPVIIGAGTKIEPFTYIEGPADIGKNCVIRTKCSFRRSDCGNNCDLKGEIEDCKLGQRVTTYASCIMLNSFCVDDCNLGAHINRTQMGHRVKAKYGNINLLDATIGNDVNIGAGATTFNFDGDGKKPTFIGDGTFIGGNVAVIAAHPVRRIGSNAYLVAGLTIREDIPDDTYVDPTGKHRPNKMVNDGKGHWIREEKK